MRHRDEHAQAQLTSLIGTSPDQLVKPRIHRQQGAASPSAGSEPYTADNFLDRRTTTSTLEFFYRHQLARERELVLPRVPVATDVLSIGCGWHPGRHLFPAATSRLVAVDANPDIIAGVLQTGVADEAHVGLAGHLDFLPRSSFDVVLYRLVLHHIVYKDALAPCLLEAARLLRPGGALVAIEPGAWHPVGAGLAFANRLGLGQKIHGTIDDVPLSPRALLRESTCAGLLPELYALTYSWRRLPPRVQASLGALDTLGARRWAAFLGHTLLLIARAPQHAKARTLRLY